MTESINFAEFLHKGVVVFDGAMGTEIYRHHVFTNRCFDELAISDPKLVRKIHQAYCDAGADVLTTNTFGANRIALEKFGLAEQQRDIITSAVKIAREVADAADRPIFVAGSIGPIKVSRREENIEELLLPQIDALAAAGADFILFETQPHRAALLECASAMRQRPDVPYIFSAAFYEDGETASGEPVELVYAPLPDELPAPIAWGANCGSGPSGLLPTVEKILQIIDKPLVVQPNAGVPKEVENRRIYLCSPEYLAEYAKRFVNLGAAAVGGCCGTTPEHIQTVANAVKPLTRARVKPVVLEPSEPVETKEPVPLADRSRFACRLVNNQWVTSVELVPPRGYDLTNIIEKSRLLHRRGVDAINIPDGPRASSRISPFLTADRIQREAMIEVILHFCCRDRNLIGMQADLLACANRGIHNILFVTGDPPKLGNYPHATGVFDTDSIGMTAVQHRLNQGVDLGGQAIDPPTAAVLGVGLDPTAIDQKRELDRFQQKLEAGAEFAITQPVFDAEALLAFLDKIGDCPIPIVAGIWPLASFRNATFLQNEVPGVVIPDAIMQRMEAATSREDQMKTGVEIARELVGKVRDRMAGIQVSAPFGKVEIALAVIEG